jgi:hypothetical protein
MENSAICQPSEQSVNLIQANEGDVDSAFEFALLCWQLVIPDERMGAYWLEVCECIAQMRDAARA